MALTHVLRWTDEHGYQKVTIAEAEKLYPYRVHAYSKLLVCGICGQGVTFTKGEIRERYFRHGEDSQDKECEDRSRNYGYGQSSLKLPERIQSLPLRLIKESGHWRLELGLLALQEAFVKKYAEKIICISNAKGKTFRYSVAERLHPNCLTWLDAGIQPSEYFRLSFSDGSPMPFFWPPQVKAMEIITFFDAKTGRRLPFFPDVEVGREYIVAIHGRLDTMSCYDVKIEFIRPTEHGWTGYSIYSVKATRFSREAGSFFVKLNANLKRKLPLIFPMWPVVIRTPHLIYHNTDELFLLLEGEDLTSRIYSSKPLEKTVETQNARLVRFHCGLRKQLVSGDFDTHHIQLGRYSHTLRYDYFIRDSLSMKAELPEVTITDIKGNTLAGDSYKELKPGTRIYVQCEFDGEVWLENKNSPLPDRRILKGGTALEVELGLVQRLTVFQGLDRVRTIKLDCPDILPASTLQTETAWTDAQVCRRLRRMEGNEVEDPRAVAEFIRFFREWNSTYAWLRQRQVEGHIPAKTKEFLHSVIKESKKEKI